MNNQLLLVEDDEHMGFLLKQNFEKLGYGIDLCAEGKKALSFLRRTQYDLVLLDLMLPDENGFDIAKKMKTSYPNIPFLFLTAVNTETEKFIGYELGAEDYITKPFSFKELEYKVQVILRRHAKSEYQEYVIGDVRFNYALRTLHVKTEQFKLTRRESDVLYIFLQKQNQVVPRKEVLLKLWEREDKYTLRSMDVHLAKLRKILSRSRSIFLENIYGEGHRLVVTEDDQVLQA